jgi:hypothetical protein
MNWAITAIVGLFVKLTYFAHTHITQVASKDKRPLAYTRI